MAVSVTRSVSPGETVGVSASASIQSPAHERMTFSSSLRFTRTSGSSGSAANARWARASVGRISQGRSGSKPASTSRSSGTSAGPPATRDQSSVTPSNRSFTAGSPSRCWKVSVTAPRRSRVPAPWLRLRLRALPPSSE